jgi:hypothetical protein
MSIAPATPTIDLDAMRAESQIKGFVFATCKRYISQRFSPEVYDELVAGLPESSRQLFVDPIVSSFYGEAHMHAFVTRIHQELAKGDPELFGDIMRGIAAAGINKFFRLILSLSSASFVMRRVPLLYKRLRQGPAKLHVDEEGERFFIHYDSFPWCSDPVYRSTSMANLQAAAAAAGTPFPRVRVLRASSCSMTLIVDLGEEDPLLLAEPIES